MFWQFCSLFGGHHKPVLWVPSPIQWPIGEDESGDGASLHGVQTPLHLVQAATVGRICPQHPNQLRHWTFSQCAYGFQPPLFPALEKEASCPSKPISTVAARPGPRATLLRAADRYSTAANRHRSRASNCLVDQKVWLSTRDLPLRVESKKLALKFIGPFVIEGHQPCSCQVKLPRAVRIHPTFHVSRIKPIRESIDACFSAATTSTDH